MSGRSITQVDEAFDFPLPEHLIALRPARPRDSARLLVVRGPQGPLEHAHISDLPHLLNEDDALVINDSQVRRLALSATRPPRPSTDTPVNISLLLHTRLNGNRWLAWARPARRLRCGDRLHVSDSLACTVTALRGQTITLTFDPGTVTETLEAHGQMPLPPYISRRRPADALDEQDYQTLFARVSGSAAAPTAGLHFTDSLIGSLNAKRIAIHPVTLHTGCATFAPLGDARTPAPPPEKCSIGHDTANHINRLRTQGGRCIAVGTTVLRALHAAWDGNRVQPFDGTTDLFVTPGFTFSATDALMTNFHLPRSSLFVLVCALMGTARMQDVYAEAMQHGYRFYSYGDACLLLPDA